MLWLAVEGLLKRALGFVVFLVLLGGAVWIGLDSRHDRDQISYCDADSRDPGCLFPSDVQDSACDEEIHDLSKEPHYTADYLHRWTDENACDLRFDVIVTQRGENACGGPSVAMIVMADYLGALIEGDNARVYVKDPDNVFGDVTTSSAFDPDAELPEEATDTRHRQGKATLWTVPLDEAIYLHFGNHVEKWPLDTDPPDCG